MLEKIKGSKKIRGGPKNTTYHVMGISPNLQSVDDAEINAGAMYFGDAPYAEQGRKVFSQQRVYNNSGNSR